MSKTYKSTGTNSSTYTQDRNELSDVVMSKKHSSKELRQGSSSRDGNSESTVSRASREKANIAFLISFSVPLEGRFPLPPNP